MKFSYNWLRELVDGLNEPPKELMRLITLKTAECEGLEEVGALLANACEARVVTVEKLGKNQKAVVATAGYGIKAVVCGAPNCRPGLRTIYVPLGKKTIEGVESDGMLASAAELGISRDHSGIVELNGRTAHPADKMPALNGETYELDPANLVIADPEGAVALAGVIGGADSA